MTRNKALMSQASYEYKLGLRKKGISTFVPMLNLLQVPLLITWFLSLRYMSNLPELYPQMLSEGYLWFSDLSTYDPYFVLPVTAACITSLAVARSPNLNRPNPNMTFLAPYIKYLKYLHPYPDTSPSHLSLSLLSSPHPSTSTG
jgi:membrane protein insertase Oxa1/YidC/SpoIIIJ